METPNSNTNNKNGWGQVIIIVILSVLLVITGFLYFNELQKSKILTVKVVETTEEKDSLSKEFDSILLQYEDLKTDNDSLNVKLEKEQNKIKKYIAEIKNLKTANKEVIEQYKKELETLRKIMRGFIHQVDSLNTLNQELTVENKQVHRKFKAEQNKNKELSQKFDSASTIVAKASIIKPINILVKALNQKGKEVTKAKKTAKFGVTFTLSENVVAKPGMRWVYIRIARPDELVLIESEQNLFSFQGQEIAFSAKREIEYLNKDIEATIYYTHNNPEEVLMSGTYIVDIFLDGNMVGTSTITLK